MLFRFAIVLLVLFAISAGINSCRSQMHLYVHLHTVGSTPYLLSVYPNPDSIDGTLFDIHTPRNDAWDEWQSVLSERTGPAYGITALPVKTTAADGAEVSVERLAVFHDRRVSVIDASAAKPVIELQPLPFKWPAETGITLNGTHYVFGAESSKRNDGDGFAGPLRVAAFDGKTWKELELKGPQIEHRYGFYLRADREGNAIRIYWRALAPDRAIGIFTEGNGPLHSVLFDGSAFEAKVTEAHNIPDGHISPAGDTGTPGRLLVAGRAPNEALLSQNGELQFWTVSPDGSARIGDESLDASRERSGMLPFHVAEYSRINGVERLLRTNLQTFEVWRRDANGNWVAARTISGLRTFDLEARALLLGASIVGLLAFGAGAAYLRRKQALHSAKRIEAQDLYATLGLRIGAYVVDYTLVLALTSVVVWLVNGSQTSILVLASGNGSFLPSPPHLAVYIAYFTLLEWLTGRTPGKLLMGLRVVMDGGEPLTFWAALLRNTVGFIERTFPFSSVAIAMIAFGPRRQRLGDLFARSFVVHSAALDLFQKQRLQDQALSAAGGGGEPKEVMRGKDSQP